MYYMGLMAREQPHDPVPELYSTLGINEPSGILKCAQRA
jgi:hypothetical protein